MYWGCEAHLGTCTDCACAAVTFGVTFGGGTDVLGTVHGTLDTAHDTEQHDHTGSGTDTDIGTETGTGRDAGTGGGV